MSVFRVKLNNTGQGTLDVNSATGVQFATSIQRTALIMGPNRKQRLLKDGDEFTDCNYWKRFAYPQMSLEEAFIQVVEDDGSVYSDVASENVYLRVWTLNTSQGDTYEDQQADIIGDTGSHAVFCQITNLATDEGDDVRIRINGSANAIFDLKAGQTQVFNVGELSVTLVEVDNTQSGVGDVTVQILASIASNCSS